VAAGAMVGATCKADKGNSMLQNHYTTKTAQERLEKGESQGERLGSTTDFASTQEKTDSRNWRNDTVSSRYALQDISKSLLPKHRINICMRVPVLGTGQIELWKDTKSGHAHLKGVGRCGSFWVCPVCAAKISIGRRTELEEGMSKARALGWYPVFVTYTARHTRDDSLQDMKDKTRKAQRLLKSGRFWQENIKAHGLKGTITGIETTYGHANGWHVHYHAIMFFEQFVDIKHLEQKLFERWYTVLGRNGLDCDREHGVIVLPANNAARYISKWGIENEIANQEHKDARDGHFTPFDLLREYAKGEKWAGARFQEFSKVFKGVSQLRWSKGLRDELEVGERATDQELVEEEVSEKSVLVGRLTWDQFKCILREGKPGVVGDLLMVAESSSDALYTWLLFEFNILLDEQQFFRERDLEYL